MRYFAERGDEVHLASTFRCSPELPLRGVDFTPVAYSQARSGAAASAGGLTRTARLKRALRYFLGPLTVPRAARALRRIQDRVQPDLVHAMRIPFEGMLAADAYDGTPLLISIWGNDLTLHAPSNPMMRHYAGWALGVAHGLHADCRRDIRLGRSWGFPPSRPTCIVPGNGGVRVDIFHAPATPVEAPVIVNPRGARSYVRTDIFLQAAALVLARRPDARFLCPALAGDRPALDLLEKLQIGNAVELLPSLSETEMADLLRRSQVLVSPSVHDGTPNSLLEGMASGCLPVAGNLESIREWITPGRNGLLADATNARDLADAMLEALANKNLRLQAADLNRDIVLERAEYTRCMRQVDTFYQRIISSR